MNNRRTGLYGEQIAAEYLKNNGYRIVARNVLFKNGELDIIAYDGDILVFVEVKTRDNERFGLPVESVTQTKRKSLISCAKQYIAKHLLYGREVRFDIISVLRDNVEHIKDAFWIN